jgi:hypothetical protein
MAESDELRSTQGFDGMGMNRIKDFYYLLFLFWVRADLLTTSREDRALKAQLAIVISQAWVLVGGFTWARILLGIELPPVQVYIAAVVALFVVNGAILKRGGWEAFDARFSHRTPKVQRGLLVLAGAVHLAALAFLLGAVVSIRSGN